MSFFPRDGLEGGESISDEDLAILVSGGVPQTESLLNGKGRLKSMAIAAKYAISTKEFYCRVNASILPSLVSQNQKN